MKENVMLITLLEDLMCILFILIVGIVLKLALTPREQEQSEPDDPDFEQFYLELLGADLTVDYTREEAQILYRVCLNLEKEKHYETFW